MSELTLTVDLLQRAQGGDAAAQNRLLERYQPRIFQIVRMLMGDRLRRQMDSADLVQETMLEAIRRLADFEPRGPGSLLAWLKKLARSAVCAEADRLIARKRYPDRVVSPQLGSSTSGPGVDPPAGTAGPLERLAQSEASVQIESCIAELAEKDRDLILLRNYAEQPWAEIAVETGRASADAARAAYAEAKARLAILVSRRTAAAEGDGAAS